MKAVEGWLRMNLSMLQMTIQGLEMQRTTVSAVQTMGKMASDTAKSMSPGAEEPAAAVDAEKRHFRGRHVAVANDAADARPDAAKRRCRDSGSRRRSRGRKAREGRRGKK
ncbi:MAG: hypothetical protein IPL05_05530 [Betaproteobacteria bacterium]|nr:hypothetical protein [Betaproteobacteria bacterium]